MYGCSEYARDLKVRLETGNDESEGGRELWTIVILVKYRNCSFHLI